MKISNTIIIEIIFVFGSDLKQYYHLILMQTKMENIISVVYTLIKYSLQGTTQGRYLTGGVPPVRFSM